MGRIKMHEYSPLEGYLLRRFRVKLSTGRSVTFEDGGVYEVAEQDAEFLLSVRTRPDSSLARYPLAFERVEDEDAAPPMRVGAGDLKAMDVSAPVPPRRIKPKTKPKTKAAK